MTRRAQTPTGRRLALVRLLALAGAVLAAASAARAATITIETDTTWLTKGSTTSTDPAAGWNTDAAYDTTGWTNAVVTSADCSLTADCIWFDAVNSETRYAWFRKTFVLSDSVLSAILFGGVDDDADIYVNGVRVLNDQSGMSEGFNLDVSAFLVQGINLIAVKAEDNIPVFGQNHAFASTLTVETPTAVPEPASMVLLTLGSLAVGGMQRRKYRRG